MKQKRKSKDAAPEDVIWEVEMSPQTLDTMLRHKLLEAQIVFKLTPKGINALLKGRGGKRA